MNKRRDYFRTLSAELAASQEITMDTKHEIHPVFGSHVPSVITGGKFYPLLIHLDEGIVAKLQTPRAIELLEQINGPCRELLKLLEEE